MARSMFERQGGFAKLSKVVIALYDKALDSDVIGAYFEDMDMHRLVAPIMGGPASQDNATLRQLHARLSNDQEAFGDMAALLEETLEDLEYKREYIDQIMAEAGAVVPTSSAPTTDEGGSNPAR